MTELNKALERAAPRVPVPLTVEPQKDHYPISVEVMEPDDQYPFPVPRTIASSSVPAFATASTNSTTIPDPLSSAYRIPRSAPPPASEPRAHRLSKKKSAVLADKVAKRELKQRRKMGSRNKQNCTLCKISCNSRKVYNDHINSRSHRIRRENKANPPRCHTCSRSFESHEHLNRHKQGSAHLKVVKKLAK